VASQLPALSTLARRNGGILQCHTRHDWRDHHNLEAYYNHKAYYNYKARYDVYETYHYNKAYNYETHHNHKAHYHYQKVINSISLIEYFAKLNNVKPLLNLEEYGNGQDR